MTRIRRMHKVCRYLAPSTVIDVVGVASDESSSTSFAVYCHRDPLRRHRLVIGIERRQTQRRFPAHDFVALGVYFDDLLKKVAHLFGRRHHLFNDIIGSLRQLMGILGSLPALYDHLDDLLGHTLGAMATTLGFLPAAGPTTVAIGHTRPFDDLAIKRIAVLK